MFRAAVLCAAAFLTTLLPSLPPAQEKNILKRYRSHLTMIVCIKLGSETDHYYNRLTIGIKKEDTLMSSFS
jgi:hypothetical protein